jgi:hypothetical protein
MQRLNLSAEDCIAVIDLATLELAPDPLLVAKLAATASHLDEWQVVWDLRGPKGEVYNDHLDAYAEAVATEKASKTVLVSPERQHEVEDALRLKLGWETRVDVLETRAKPLVKRPLDLGPFSDDWTGNAEDTITPADVSWGHGVDMKSASALLSGNLETAIALGIIDDRAISPEFAPEYFDDVLIDNYTLEESAIRVEEEVEEERASLLDRFLRQIASNSLLAQLAFVHNSDRISVVPLHGNGLHDLDCGDSVLAVRPFRRGSVTQWQHFAGAIGELEELINRPDVKEAEIEALLRRHPLFLRGLNYAEAYHQVVLPMEDGRSLRPDVIVEPASENWCDIIDLKLPGERVFVGSGDRPRLSQAIAQAAAQLRQYARWFDDRKVAKAIEEQYGFRCYRPRQVVIIGRDPREFSDGQREAARSAYPDLEIVTYDQLLKAARSRLLF